MEYLLSTKMTTCTNMILILTLTATLFNLLFCKQPNIDDSLVYYHPKITILYTKNSSLLLTEDLMSKNNTASTQHKQGLRS